MRPLLLVGLRHLRQRPLRFLLVFSAVALGVALFVSSFASITGVETAIRNSGRALAGKAEWRVAGGGPGGVPESLVASLQGLPGAVAAPIVQASATVVTPRFGRMTFIGVDVGTDAMTQLYGTPGGSELAAGAGLALVPDSVVLTRQFADDHGLRVGDTIRVAARRGLESLTVVGLINDFGPSRAFEGRIGIVELHQAQRLFGTPGFVDRVEIASVTKEDLARVAKGYSVRSTSELPAAAQDAVARVQALYAFSVVALLIGCLVILNSVQVTLMERIKEIATFRAIGASRRQILSAVAVEWGLVGVLGSVAGVSLGFWLASFLVNVATRTVNSIVPVVAGAKAELSPMAAVAGVVVGVACTGAGAFLPAIGAAWRPPLEALRPHTYRMASGIRRAFFAGLPIMAAGLAFSVVAKGSLVSNMVGVVLAFLGLAMALPYAVVAIAGRLKRLAVTLLGFPGMLAMDSLGKVPQRTSLNVIALGGALAMMVATAAFVQGLGTSTSRWIRASLPFDLAVMASDMNANLYSEETIPSSLLSGVRKVEGVSLAYGVRKVFAPYGKHDLMVIGVETGPYLEAHRRADGVWARPMMEPEAVWRLTSGEGAFVSDNFLTLSGLRVGDPLTIGTPSGPRTFQIVGSLEEYSWPQGTIILDLHVLQRAWRDDSLTYIDLQVASPSRFEEVRLRLSELLSQRTSLYIFDRKQILAVADDVIRQTTAMADIQVWLAALIGLLTIGNSLVMTMLHRKRELGLLRAIGMPVRQLQRTVFAEALFVSLAAGAFGIGGGLVAAWLPLRSFTFSITGFLFPMTVPWAHLAVVFVAALAVGVLASLIPMHLAARLPVLEAITYE